MVIDCNGVFMNGIECKYLTAKTQMECNSLGNLCELCGLPACARQVRLMHSVFRAVTITPISSTSRRNHSVLFQEDPGKAQTNSNHCVLRLQRRSVSSC